LTKKFFLYILIEKINLVIQKLLFIFQYLRHFHVEPAPANVGVGLSEGKPNGGKRFLGKRFLGKISEWRFQFSPLYENPKNLYFIFSILR